MYVYATFMNVCAFCNNFFSADNAISETEHNMGGEWENSHLTYAQYPYILLQGNHFSFIFLTFCLAIVSAECVEFCLIDLVVERTARVRCLAVAPFLSSTFMNRMV